MCSKCNMTHSYKDCPAFGKKCHKYGFKNHFSSCCRSTQSNGQGQGCQRGRTPAHGRSTERCHWPNRGWCSRSRSHSRSGSQTHNTHSIEIDWYNIEDIDILRTFHSISRSKTVASITNDTDLDGKTKIMMKLRIKLPYRIVADIMEVKVNDGAKANILPLHTFRSMFPHKLDDDGYPKDGFLKGYNVLQWWQASESWYDNIETQTLLKGFLSRPSILCCRNTQQVSDLVSYRYCTKTMPKPCLALKPFIPIISLKSKT